MAKKAASKASGKSSAKKPEGMSAEDHRKMSRELYAKGRLHDAKADLMEAKNPPKKSSRGCINY